MVVDLTQLRVGVAVRALLPLVVVAIALPTATQAEQASQPTSAAAGLDADASHSCALLGGGSVRCWGLGFSGQLGYGNKDTVGDNEVPAAAGPVDLGAGRTAAGIAAGADHTCARLEDAGVRCWGFGGDGRLGYGNQSSVGDDEAPGSVGSVDLGPDRTAKAVSAGEHHTCAVLDDGKVRCWGFAYPGRLGTGTSDVGDDETPGSVAPVYIGEGRTATAISAGDAHSCALLDDGSVRCWGYGANGRLGYGNQSNIGDDERPGSVGPVDLGAGHKAKAVSAGDAHSCALLDDGSVRCWGYGGNGRLGYGNQSNVGDDEAPGSVGPVYLGLGRTAVGVSAGRDHTCALLDDGSVRCWGYGANGRLGYGNQSNVGDDEAPGSVGPVDLGPGRTASAISAGGHHTCARLDDASVRCWGYGTRGRLGLCNERDVGDDETPGSVAPVALSTGNCGGSAGGSGSPITRTGATSEVIPHMPNGLQREARRRRALQSCHSRAVRHTRRETRRARRLSGHRRARATRHIKRHKSGLRRVCLTRHGRIPARVTGLRARAASSSSIVLRFRASGSHGNRPPAARSYIVKQSRRPLRSARAFRRAQTLCEGSCQFPGVTRVGTELSLIITDLRPRATYYYAVAARDNVSCRAGPRSRPVKARTSTRRQQHSGSGRAPNGGGDRSDACRRRR